MPASVFGDITNPLETIMGLAYASSAYAGTLGGQGLLVLLNNILKLVIVVAGVYSFINIIIAGYTFLSSPEPKDIAKAWGRIYQSMYGLLIIAGSFVLAAIFGYMIFGNWSALLTPVIYGP